MVVKRKQKSLPDLLGELSHTRDRSIPKEYPYRSLYHWVYENGIPLDSQRLTAGELSIVEEHLKIHAHSLAFGCFNFAQQLVLSHHVGSTYGKERLLDLSHNFACLTPFTYHEGYVKRGPNTIPQYWAWVTIGGKVVDCVSTPPLSSRSALPQFVLGTFPRGWEYYGVALAQKQIADCALRNAGWHSVIDDPVGNWPLLAVE